MEPLYVSAIVKIAVVRCGLVGMIWSSRGSGSGKVGYGLRRGGLVAGWTRSVRYPAQHTMLATLNSIQATSGYSLLLHAALQKPRQRARGKHLAGFLLSPIMDMTNQRTKIHRSARTASWPDHGVPRASRRAKGPRYQSLEPGGWGLRSLGEQVLAMSACHGRTSSSLPTAHWPESECICQRLKNRWGHAWLGATSNQGRP
jgi:hypothetical protein